MPVGRDAFQRSAAAVAPGRERSLRIRRQLQWSAGVYDIDLEPPCFEVTRYDERIAAIIAGAGDDEHAAPTVGGNIARDLRCSETGALHQPRRRVRFDSRGFEIAYLGGTIHRQLRV